MQLKDTVGTGPVKEIVLNQIVHMLVLTQQKCVVEKRKEKVMENLVEDPPVEMEKEKEKEKIKMEKEKARIRANPKEKTTDHVVHLMTDLLNARFVATT